MRQIPYGNTILLSFFSQELFTQYSPIGPYSALKYAWLFRLEYINRHFLKSNIAKKALDNPMH